MPTTRQLQGSSIQRKPYTKGKRPQTGVLTQPAISTARVSFPRIPTLSYPPQPPPPRFQGLVPAPPSPQKPMAWLHGHEQEDADQALENSSKDLGEAAAHTRMEEIKE